jgi:hypothetical protein
MRVSLKSEGVDMRITKFLEIGVAVVVGTLFMNSIALFAEKGNSQNPIMRQPVRLSYSSSWVPAGEKSSPKICLSVWPDGHYRILRADDKGQSQLRQGIVPARQLKQLRWLLEAPDFQALSGSHGGLLREGADSFVAEIPRGGAVQHMAWMVPDGKSKFPKSIADIVGWVQDFRPENGEVLLQTDFPDVCPHVGGLQPVVANNSNGTVHDSCTSPGN